MTLTLANAGVLFSLAACSAMASQVSLPRPFAAPGSTLTLPILFISQADSASTVQFDLEYDSSVMTLSAVAGESARTAGKTLSLSDIAPNRKRFLIAGLNQAPIADGPLVTLFVTLALDAPDGLHTLRLLGVLAADANANPLVPDTVDGALIAYRVLGPPVPLQADRVLNGASLLPGPVAPGEVIRVVGSAPAGSVLSFDGTPAQLLSAPPNQFAAVVPLALSGTVTRLQLTSQGPPLAEVLLPVVPAAPAIFTADASGTGQGTILNEDLTPNSAVNPAVRGSIITLSATGLGKALDTTSVRVGGIDCPLLYTESPDISPGVLLVKCKVPAQVPIGYTVPVYLLSGGAASQVGVTIAIE